MQVITIEAEVFQDLLKKLVEIEKYVKRTSDIFTDIDNFLELSSHELLNIFSISKSTLYRWRQDHLIPFRYDSTGKILYPYKDIVKAIQNGELILRNMNTTEMLISLANFKDNIITNIGITNAKSRHND